MNALKFITIMLFTGSLIAQSPWTKERNTAYIQLTYSMIPSYSELHGNPSYSTERKITDNTLQLYSEYGLTNKTTAFASLPIKMVESGSLNSGTTGITVAASKTALGNVQFGVKHNFYHQKWLLTAQLGVEANTSAYYEYSGLRTGYDAWTITPLCIVGRGFTNWYIQVFTGFDIRTNEYSSNYKLGGELGYKAVNGLWVAGRLDGVASLTNGNIEIPAQNIATGLYVNNQSFAAFELKLIGEITTHFGVNGAIGGALSGRNVARKPAYNIGVYYKM